MKRFFIIGVAAAITILAVASEVGNAGQSPTRSAQSASDSPDLRSAG